MIILIIILAVYAALRPVKQPLKTPAQIEREYRAIIREQERQYREVERLAREQERQRAQYMALYDRLTAEMDTATPARQNAITRQIIALDEKLYRLDTRKLRAFNAANAA